MIELNKKHPKYDLCMEILCTLPIEPEALSHRELADEFFLRGPLAVARYLQELQDRGYAVHSHNVKGKGRAANVRRSGWAKVRNDCLHYWRTVNA